MRRSRQRDKKVWSVDLIDRYKPSGDDGGTKPEVPSEAEQQPLAREVGASKTKPA